MNKINIYMSYLRAAEWLDSKVPFMLGALIYSFVFGQTRLSVSGFYLCFLFYALYISMFLAFSYVLNDFYDFDIDKAAGKYKVMHNLDKKVVMVTMILMVVSGCAPLYFLVSNKILYIVYTIVLYVFGAAYSAPFLFRFKERGVPGLIECAVAQRCLPLIPIALLASVPIIDFCVMVMLSFFNGLRYILVHQAIDAENDRKTGVKTYVSEGNEGYRKWIIACTLIETVMFSILVIKIVANYHFMVIIIPIYIMFKSIIYIFVTKYMKVDWMTSFLAVPLESFYNFFFPVITSLMLLTQSVLYTGILIIIVALTNKCFRGKFAFIKTYIMVKTGRYRGGKNA